MQLSEQSKFTATYKAGTTFDAPWIVSYFDTVEEGLAAAAAIGSSGLDVAVANAAKELQAKYAVASGGMAPQQVSSTPVAAPQAAPAQTYQQPAPAAAAPAQTGGAPDRISDRYGNIWTYDNPGAPACAHGVAYVLKEGTNKVGKPYKGYFCALKGPKPVSLAAPECQPDFNSAR